ncbi:MAG: U32 family peptidase [Gammaproteobacteria bacterium]
MRLAIGPVLYHWSDDRLIDFYRTVAEAPVDIVYLGETVCSKRRSLKWTEWLKIGHMLQDRDKEVVLSTLTLVEAESELSQIERVCTNGEFLVEANDMAAIHVLAENGHPFVGGAALNIYNAQTLARLQQLGLTRWIPPLELSGVALGTIARERDPDAPEIELFAFGRMPLAYSARCFTARAHDLTRDHCDFICSQYPSGLKVETQDGQHFFALNGLQTQSGRILNLLPHRLEFSQTGISILRISPDAHNTVELIHRIRDALDGGETPHVSDLIDASTCDGYWQSQAGFI